MKRSGTIVLTIACALSGITINGQTIDMAAHLDEATIVQLGEANATALKNKISYIITRNGMADAAGLFAVVPTLSITGENTVDTGMTTLRVVRADLTLAVKNIYDNVVFASQTIPLQAQAGSDEAALRSLINKVNPGDIRFARLIKDVQQSIADYYTRQMPAIIAKVNSLVAREQWEDAMAALAIIPENVAEYEQVAQMQVDIYNKMTGTSEEAGESADPSAAAQQSAGSDSGEAASGTIRAKAKAEAKALKDKRAEESAKSGRSLGQWLFGL
jgi:hypothetical protein